MANHSLNSGDWDNTSPGHRGFLRVLGPFCCPSMLGRTLKPPHQALSPWPAASPLPYYGLKSALLLISQASQVKRCRWPKVNKLSSHVPWRLLMLLAAPSTSVLCASGHSSRFSICHTMFPVPDSKKGEVPSTSKSPTQKPGSSSSKATKSNQSICELPTELIPGVCKSVRMSAVSAFFSSAVWAPAPRSRFASLNPPTDTK